MEDAGNVEALRLILECEQVRPVANAEAAEVAESLIIFFETLAEDMEIEEQALS